MCRRVLNWVVLVQFSLIFFFSDDPLFFLKADTTNCSKLTKILSDYCAASGQSINLNKSSLFFTPNTPTKHQEIISSIFEIRGVDNPGKYLGLPAIWGRSKHDALSYIRSRVKSKISGWKQGAFSLAGKEIFIKAVATTVPSYPMSCFFFQPLYAMI